LILLKAILLAFIQLLSTECRIYTKTFKLVMHYERKLKQFARFIMLLFEDLLKFIETIWSHTSIIVGNYSFSVSDGLLKSTDS
jgi:hypothetical protein